MEDFGFNQQGLDFGTQHPRVAQILPITKLQMVALVLRLAQSHIAARFHGMVATTISLS